jgi:type I restriction enzyme, S subunit
MTMPWPTLALEELASVQRGKFSARPRNDPKYYGGDIPFIQTGDVANGAGRVRTYSQTLNDDGLSVSKLFPRGSLVVTIAANIGDVARVEFDFACPDSLVVVQANEGVNSDWLQYNLESKKELLDSLAPQNAQKNINLEVLRPLALDVPPLGEQQRIAGALGSWDDAIQTTEQLIAAKERRKAGLMAELLTGRRRLARFQTKWRSWHLGELLQERVENNRSDLPLLSIKREEGVIPRDGIDRKDTSSEDKSKYLRICRGDIGYNTMRMWQGVSALSRHEGIVSPAYTVCIPGPEIDGTFASYLFKLPAVVHLFYRYSQGLTSDTWNLKFHHFAAIRVHIPEPDEQIAIASLLLTVDEELALIKLQREALAQQKRGLMQKLLTGQWRLPVQEEAN